jgi:hypothetical protein
MPTNTTQCFSVEGDNQHVRNSRHSIDNPYLYGPMGVINLSQTSLPPRPPETPNFQKVAKSAKTQPKGGASPLSRRGNNSKWAPVDVLEVKQRLRDVIIGSLEAGRVSCDEEERAKLSDWLERIGACAEGATFYTDLATGRPRLSGKLCRCRACPICGWRRELKNAKVWAARIEAFRAKNPTYRLLYLTLTMSRVLLTELKSACHTLNTAFGALVKKFNHAFAGYFRLIEVGTVKRDPDIEPPMQAHPHIHAIMVQPPKNGRTYVKPTALAAAWAKLMGSSEPLDFKVQPVTNVFGAIKYASKSPFEWEIRDDFDYVGQLALAMHGVRLGAAGGVLRGITH